MKTNASINLKNAKAIICDKSTKKKSYYQRYLHDICRKNMYEIGLACNFKGIEAWKNAATRW